MADRLRRTPSAASSRRTLEQRPVSTASSSRDVFSDGHAYDDMVVADGFRPTEMNMTTTTITPPQPRPTPFLRQQPTPPPPPSSRPAEDSKPEKRPSMLGAGASFVSRNSFSLRHDSHGGPLRRESTRTEMSQRPNSMISTFSLLPSAQSPYVGASGPSHPYGMYPQDTSLNRSSSTSESTSEATTQQQQPAHPYGMYTQTTNADLAGSTDIASIGFPGLGRSYARRLGPDGEDADDIIGPDGHTEQLPPYTRYPDGQPRYKEQYAASVETPPPGSDDDTTAVAASSSSTNERLLPVAERSDDDGGPAVTEEGTPPKWAQKGKRRYFGNRIPAWLIWVGIILLAIAAATIGGVIGRRMNNKGYDDKGKFNKQFADGDDQGNTSARPTAILTITTTLIDASPIATPPNTPPLPMGDFAFPLGAPSQASSGCLADPRHAAAGAWACADEGAMNWTVRASMITATQVTLFGHDPTEHLSFGPQVPSMVGPVGLDLVADVEKPEMGPAYFFQSVYTKEVILPERALDPAMDRRDLAARLRDAFRSSSSSHTLAPRDGKVGHNETMWVCSWENTLLEGFIYVTDPDDDDDDDDGPLSIPAPPAGSSPPTAPAPTAPPRIRGRGWHHGGGHGGGGHGGGGGQGGGGDDHDDETDDAADETDDGVTAKQVVGPSFTFPMKIVERRAARDLSNPTCQQMRKKHGDGDPYSKECVRDKAGKPIVLQLTETDPASQDKTAALIKAGGDPSLRKRSDDACVCQWMTAPWTPVQ